jgi:hypothetical protein
MADFGTDKKKDIQLLQRKLKDDEISQILLQSWNKDALANPTPFLQSFWEMEKRAAHGCTFSELVDLRIGQWIFMYVILRRPSSRTMVSRRCAAIRRDTHRKGQSLQSQIQRRDSLACPTPGPTVRRSTPDSPHQPTWRVIVSRNRTTPLVARWGRVIVGHQWHVATIQTPTFDPFQNSRLGFALDPE